MRIFRLAGTTQGRIHYSLRPCSRCVVHQLRGRSRGGATLGTACRQVTAQLLRKHGVQPSGQSAAEAAGGESSEASSSDDAMEEGSGDGEAGSGDGEEDCVPSGHVSAAEAADESHSGDEEGSEGESDNSEVNAVSGDEAAVGSAGLAPAAGARQEAGRVPLPAPAPSRPVRSSLA